MAKWRPILIGGAVVAVAAVTIHSLISPDPTTQRNTADEAEAPPTEPGLTLKDVTLEQPDEDGTLLYRVQGEVVTYSPDQQIAYVTRPDSELFQDGEAIYQVIADTGEIRDNGNVIFLRGNIVATGLKNGSVLRGNELEWRPQEDILIVRDQITGSHPQIRAVANEARVYNRENRMELEGNVVANTVVKDPQTDPWLKLQADQLVWFWDEERIDSAQPVRVEQFKQNAISDVVVGQRGSVDLAAQIVALQGAVAMQMLELPLNATSEAMTWQVAQEIVDVPQPLTVTHPQEKLVATARRGQMHLGEKVVQLNYDVVVVGDRNQSRLTADALNWSVEDQTVVAIGQVNYQQINPDLNLSGSQAVGRLNDQTILVNGGPVITKIVPN